VNAVWTTVLADLKHRRLQAAVVAVLVLLASANAALAVTLLVQSSTAYASAFAHQRGSHLQVSFDASKITSEQLAATGDLIGAAATAGPFLQSPVVRIEHGGTKYNLTLIGRSGPEAAVNVLQLTAGRWVESGEEIVVTRSFARTYGIALGERLTLLSRNDKPAVTVVGEAVDVNQAEAASSDQSAWVLPASLPSLISSSGSLQMLYRFGHDPSAGDLTAKMDRLTASLPAGAIGGSSSYINTQRVINAANAFLLNLLLAFCIFTIVAAAAIVGNVVTATVLDHYRDIGILKAVGFSPGQVIGLFMGQMVAIALAASIPGTLAGALVSQTLLQQRAADLGLQAPSAFIPAVDAGIVALMLLIVAVGALIPAWRAGRLSPVRALTMATAPRTMRRSRLARLLGRLGLPRAVSLGAGSAFIRPLRGGLTAGGVLAGVATLTLAVGLLGTAGQYVKLHPSSHIQVQVDRIGTYPDERVMATLASQPETAAVVAIHPGNALVPGVSDFVNIIASRGDLSQLGYRLTSGRWFAQPGDAVVSSGLLRVTNHRVGDVLDITLDGHPLRLHVVGTLLEGINLAHQIRIDWPTYLQAAPQGEPASYLVHLRSASDAAAYAQRVQRSEPDFLAANVFGLEGVGPVIAMAQMTFVLGVLLALVAIAAVFNTLVLNTRERTQDTAILRALGMSPGATVVMVTTAAAVLGMIGGIVGMPAGMAFHHGILAAVSQVVGNDLPSEVYEVFNPVMLPLLATAGILIAVLGGLVPGWWASRLRVADVLRAE
jgi:putative ABC transport system permease protein